MTRRRVKNPTLPETLMPPETAVRMLRSLDGNQFKKAALWEIAAIIEQLAAKVHAAPNPLDQTTPDQITTRA